ncbi:MAG: hypothetical protein Kow00107_02230 [Planctomycetota bacterium]
MLRDVRRSAFAILVVACFGISVACGGGGGGGTSSATPSVSPSTSPTASPSDTPTPTPTTTPATLTVISSDPADGEEGVPTLKQIRVTFSEAMDETTTESAFSLAADETLEGLFSWEDDGATLVFTPLGILDALTQYTIRVETSARNADLSLQLSAAFVASFTTAGSENPDAPTVTASDPTWSLQAVPVDKVISVEFSKAMNRASVESAFSLTLVNGDGSPTAGEFTWNTESTSFQFEPDEPLDYGTTYTMSISTDAQSSDAISMALPYTVVFFTEGDPSAPPTVTFSFPIEGMTGAPTDSVITVTFSVPMNTTVTSLAFSLIEVGAGPVAGFHLWQENTLVFRPSSYLKPSTAYEYIVSTSARSAQDVPLAEEYRVSFETGTGTAFHNPVPALGTLVASTLDNAPQGSLYQVTATAATQVDGEDFNVTDSKWSPAGDYMAYRKSSQTDGDGTPTAWELFSWNGTVSVQLSDSGANVGPYAWSPDGTRLAFTENLGGIWYLLVKTFPTGSLVLGQLSGAASQLFWSDNLNVVMRVGNSLVIADRTTQEIAVLTSDLNGDFRISPSRDAVAYKTYGGTLAVFDLQGRVRKGTNKFVMFDYFDFCGDDWLVYSTIEGYFPPMWQVKRVKWSDGTTESIAANLPVLDCRITSGSGAPDGTAVVYYTVSTSLDETYRANIYKVDTSTLLPEVALDGVGGTSPFWAPDMSFVMVSSPSTRSFMVSLSDGSTSGTYLFDSSWVDYTVNSFNIHMMIVGPVLYAKQFGVWLPVGVFGLTNVRCEFQGGEVSRRP